MFRRLEKTAKNIMSFESFKAYEHRKIYMQWLYRLNSGPVHGQSKPKCWFSYLS